MNGYSIFELFLFRQNTFNAYMVFSVIFLMFEHKNQISVHTVGKLYENASVQQRIETIKGIFEYSIMGCNLLYNEILVT